MKAGLKICIAMMLLWGVAGAAERDERPNILWITSEDNSVEWLGCYGNPNATTPALDQLAEEGFQYMACVCECAGLCGAAQHMDYRDSCDLNGDASDEEFLSDSA